MNDLMEFLTSHEIMVVYLIAGILCLICFAGCSNSSSKTSISYMKAKEKIINEGAILLDVRTSDEYNDKHITGSINLPLDEITKDNVQPLITNLDSIIIVYCKSGTRSAEAVQKLNDLGYKQVYDLGSMDNWKE